MTTKITTHTSEREARLALEKARATVTTWKAELGRLKTEGLPTPDNPTKLNVVSAERAVQLQRVGAATDALDKARQQEREAGRALLPYVADSYRQTAAQEGEARDTAHAEYEAALDRVGELLNPGQAYDFNSDGRRHLPPASAAETAHERAQFIALRNAEWIDAVTEGRQAWGKTLEEAAAAGAVTNNGTRRLGYLDSRAADTYIGGKLAGPIPGGPMNWSLGDGTVPLAPMLPPELKAGGEYPII